MSWMCDRAERTFLFATEHDKMMGHMSDAILKSALKLTAAERILLAQRLWDSIAEGDAAPKLTAAQEAELDRRLKRLEKTGPQGRSWADVKKRLRSGRRKR